MDDWSDVAAHCTNYSMYVHHATILTYVKVSKSYYFCLWPLLQRCVSVFRWEELKQYLLVGYTYCGLQVWWCINCIQQKKMDWEKSKYILQLQENIMMCLDVWRSIVWSWQEGGDQWSLELWMIVSNVCPQSWHITQPKTTSSSSVFLCKICMKQQIVKYKVITVLQFF